jgi:protein-S-isoprenylcysteine O-methyltransferase Ste14
MKLFRIITGYLIGLSLFGLLMPLFLVFLSRRVDPLLPFSLLPWLSVRLFISIPVFTIGLVFAIWSNVSLSLTGKGGPTDVFNYAICPRSTNLVVTGPYRYTRNPMVFGALCIYLSLSVFLNSLTGSLFCLLFIPLAILYLKKTEEKRLEKDFGEEFQKYKSSVPMLVPFPGKRKKRHNTPHKPSGKEAT